MKKNFIWYWNDGDESYENKAYSLENIIEYMIDYYFTNSTRFVFVDRKEYDESGDTFHIHFLDGETTHEYDCGANPKDVAQFLANLGDECKQDHIFDIVKI